MKKMLLMLLLLVLGMSACKKEKETDVVVQDKVTTPVSDTLGKGNFVGVAHSVAGKSILYKETTGNYILRLENFTMTAAPDAFIYLSKTSNYNASSVINVYTLTPNGNYSNANINIDVSDDINFSEYKYVLVYCFQYSAFFGHAELK